MDLRSAHKGKEKLCFSLSRRFGGGGNNLAGAKGGQTELSEKSGGAVLPFPLRKQSKNQKYLRLSRKKFTRMSSLENRNRRREFFLKEPVVLEDRQAPNDWDDATQPAKKEGKPGTNPSFAIPTSSCRAACDFSPKLRHSGYINGDGIFNLPFIPLRHTQFFGSLS